MKKNKEKKFIQKIHNSTKRDYLSRMANQKVKAMIIASKYGYDYWDGPRKYGYGGHKFIEGYWMGLAKKLIKAQLKLKELKDKKKPSVKEASNMIAMMSYNNIRQPSMIPFMAGLMVGGINENGEAELYSVEPAGSTMKVEDFDANFSSGMPYILGLLERQYKPNMTMEEGIELAIESIKSSSERDTASGHGVDVFTITKEGIKHVSKQRVENIYQEHN